MKTIFKRFLAIGIVMMVMGIFSSCETKDGDEFTPMRFNLVENSNPDNVSVTFDKRSEKKSDVIRVNVSSGGGTIGLECLNFSDMIIWERGNYEQKNESHLKYDWMEIKTKGKNLYLTFFPDVELEDQKEIEFVINSFLTLDAVIVVNRIP